MGEPDDRTRALVSELRRTLGPDRIVDEATLPRYRRDYGIFSLLPAAAVRPVTEEHIVLALDTARRHALPVVARGGGSNTGGAAITDGMLLLFDGGGFDHIEVVAGSHHLRCGSGARHDHVQRAFGELGLHLPSDPSSGPLTRIGGNVATRASGPHALRHGAINRYVVELRFITADGAVVDTRHPRTVPGRIAEGLRDLAVRLARDGTTARRLESRRDVKWASGYELLALLDHADDPVRALPRLLTGSVGTLGIVTEVELRGHPAPEGCVALLLRFANEQDACSASADLRDSAQAIELVSRSALELLRRETDVLQGDGGSGALLIVEYAGAGAAEAARCAAADAADSCSLTGAPEIAGDESTIARIWRARKALLPLLQRMTGARGVPYSVVNDVGVAPNRLAELVAGAERVFARHGLVAPVYGHAGSGNLHLRPLFPPGDLAVVRAVADEVYSLVTELGGTVTAEHGMGRLRAPFLELEWGREIAEYMRALKAVFDPMGRLNPDTMFTRPGHRFRTDGWPLPPSLSGSR